MLYYSLPSFIKVKFLILVSLMLPTLFQAVYNHPSLKAADFGLIADAHTRVDFQPGEIVLKVGKVASEFYIIETGLFRSFLHDYDGNETTTGFYCANSIVIESFSLFQRIPSKENFQAVTGVVAWKIKYETFQQLLGTIEGVREWGRAWATNELFLLKQHTIDVLTMSATERYLKLVKERPQVISQSPLKYIASYLGVTDTSLSRIRKEISMG